MVRLSLTRTWSVASQPLCWMGACLEHMCEHARLSLHECFLHATGQAEPDCPLGYAVGKVTIVHPGSRNEFVIEPRVAVREVRERQHGGPERNLRCPLPGIWDVRSLKLLQTG